VETLASSDGKALSKEDLKRLGLGDVEAVEKLRKELEKYAKGEQWKLDVVDTPAGREYRAIVGSDDDEKPLSEEGKVKTEGQQKGQQKGGKGTGKAKDEGRGKESERKPKQQSKEKQQEGSEEEFYKEEL
jgi:protein OS-9